MNKKTKKSNAPPDLTPGDKLWLYKKLESFFFGDPYLSHLDVRLALSPIRSALEVSDTVNQLGANLKEAGLDKPLKFTRKRGSPDYFFEYPPLSFQISTLLEHWDQILEVFKRYRDEHRYGHSPELASARRPKNRSSLHAIEANLCGPLKQPFTEEYPEFKKHICDTAKDLLGTNASPGRKLLLVQSDIKKFFHTLETESLAGLIRAECPELNGIVSETPRLNEFGYSSIPIGWVFSGVLVNIALAVVHRSFSKELEKAFQDRLRKILGSEISRYVALALQPVAYNFLCPSTRVMTTRERT